MPARPTPTPDDVEAILAVRDPVVRNLRITQGYHDLSQAIARRVRPGVNWCTFATWASRQAGCTIRGEDVERMIEGAVTDALSAPSATAVVDALRALGSNDDVTAIRRTLRAALGIDRAFARTGEAVMRGNLKVFQEIGAVFARFIAQRLGDPAFDAAAIAALQATLRPGDPPDGQEHLRRAFACYYAALFEDDAKTRAEQVFLANLHVGFHEQIRLQPEIAEALDAPIADPDEVVGRLLDAHLPAGAWLVRLRRTVTRLLGREPFVDRAVGAVVAHVRRVVREQLTEHVMRLELPNGVVLRLGRDLDQAAPASLRTLVNPELRDLFSRLVPATDGGSGSGATDWADFTERMHFIAMLFRIQAEMAELFGPPFTAEQVAAIDAGRRPEGRL
jgi:hypothetical protein